MGLKDGKGLRRMRWAMVTDGSSEAFWKSVKLSYSSHCETGLQVYYHSSLTPFGQISSKTLIHDFLLFEGRFAVLGISCAESFDP